MFIDRIKKYKKTFIAILLVAIVFAVCYFLFQISRSRTFQFFGELVSRVETEQKVIALTFDDAPSEYSDEVLEILAEKNVKATFYVIGKNIEKYPESAKGIVEAGHELGNHSYSHKRFLLKSPSFIKNEIEKTNQLIQDLEYSEEITFRPPNGKKLFGLPWYLSKNDIKTVMWDIEPDTYYTGNAELILKHTVENIKPGSIILMHPFCKDSCQADREALPKIIDDLKSKGYQFVTVSQLMEYEK